LPTEAEWEVAARDLPLTGNFVESGALHPLALREAPPEGIAQAFGDVWACGSRAAPDSHV